MLSSCLPSLEGVYFNRALSPHLFLFVTGPSASGKGTMIWSKYFGDEIHDQMFKETIALKEAYNQELCDYESLPKSQKVGLPKPVEPTRKMYFIPANSSSAAMIKLLAENNFKGLIFETEADTLAIPTSRTGGFFRCF